MFSTTAYSTIAISSVWKSQLQGLLVLPSTSLSSGSQLSGRSAKVTFAAASTAKSNANGQQWIAQQTFRHHLATSLEVHAGSLARSAGAVFDGGLGVPSSFAIGAGRGNWVVRFIGTIGQDLQVTLEFCYLLVKSLVLGRADVPQVRIFGRMRCRLAGHRCARTGRTWV